jgi:hypothetical protein
MTAVSRRTAQFALVPFFLVAVSLPIAAQEMRDRQLIPAFDFSRIQMPVEVVSMKRNGEQLQPGAKIVGDDDWLKGVSFTLKNISEKAIAYVDIGLQFPQPNGFVVYSLNYGVDFSRGEPRLKSSPPAIQPGESIELLLTRDRYEIFLRTLAQGGASRGFDTASYYIERVCFENEPDVIWEGGNLKRRDPNQFSKFDVIERYVLPKKQD